ncbi:hypothetical protein ACTXT7_011266 [Hymenolepis weldensis]
MPFKVEKIWYCEDLYLPEAVKRWLFSRRLCEDLEVTESSKLFTLEHSDEVFLIFHPTGVESAGVEFHENSSSSWNLLLPDAFDFRLLD